jgi:hypothetical protein
MFLWFSTACGQFTYSGEAPKVGEPVNYAAGYQAADPPAIVPRLTSFMNLRMLFPHFELGLTARRTI